jgi:hypothetical protein
MNNNDDWTEWQECRKSTPYGVLYMGRYNYKTHECQFTYVAVALPFHHWQMLLK